ncbi:hypothetical protein J6590_060871 [Homalodisca vitripennis]|nr:hypothetical protein J6590_060871 [Homalodisca vitripennis]
MEETITNELSKYSLVVTPSEEETQERNSRPAAGIEAVVPERKSGEKQMLKESGCPHGLRYPEPFSRICIVSLSPLYTRSPN